MSWRYIVSQSKSYKSTLQVSVKALEYDVSIVKVEPLLLYLVNLVHTT